MVAFQGRYEFWSSVDLTGNQTLVRVTRRTRWFWSSVDLTGNQTRERRFSGRKKAARRRLCDIMHIGGSCLTHLLRHAVPAYFFIVWSEPSCLSILASATPYLFMYLRIHSSAWSSVVDLFSLTSMTANRTPLLLATDFMCDLKVFSDFEEYTVLISMPVDRSARLTVIFPCESSLSFWSSVDLTGNQTRRRTSCARRCFGAVSI